ncbi:MAG: hypothetical protein V1859_01950 [archaeon]
MNINLESELKEKKTILVVIPNVEYQETILSLCRQLNTNYNRIAYISLNKLITPLRRTLEDNKINTEKFFFIDGITKTAIPNPPSSSNIIYVPAPNDLTKLSIAITKVLQTFDPDCLFFESMSTLLIYEEEKVISQFMYSVVNKVNAFGIRCILTCLDGRKEEILINDLSLVLDKIVKR